MQCGKKKTVERSICASVQKNGTIKYSSVANIGTTKLYNRASAPYNTAICNTTVANLAKLLQGQYFFKFPIPVRTFKVGPLEVPVMTLSV